MKIGIVTCFSDNYGACLQAYALQTILCELGGDVEIIKYKGEHGYRPCYGINRIRKNMVTIFLRSLVDKNFEKMNRKAKSFDIFRRKFLNLSSKNLFTFNQMVESANNYDVYVCGSDQIWNPILYGCNNRIYFLDFVKNGKRKVAYAPSIGISDFPDKYKESFRSLVNNIDVISCREYTGAHIIKSITGRDCKVVLDPTLLLDNSEWSDVAHNPPIKDSYIFCYIFGDNDYTRNFLLYLKKHTNYKILGIPFTNIEDLLDVSIYDAGPLDFVGLIKFATLVVTDSFHATAFSINLNTPFYTLLRNIEGDDCNMNSRVIDILGQYELGNRLIKGYSDFPERIDYNVNFDYANEKLVKQRTEDKAFIYNAVWQ